MRILSYNIYEGAHAEGLDRTEAVIKVIRAAEPDIVGLCECTRFWDDGAVRLHPLKALLVCGP